MKQYIDKSALVAEMNKLKNKSLEYGYTTEQRIIANVGKDLTLKGLLDYIDTLEMIELNLIIHTVISECCDWLAMHTNLGHDEIEGCRNLMLTVKEEQCKAQKGE